MLIHAATKPHTFLPGAIISSSDVNENFDAAFDAINTLIPAGTVMAYAGSTVPAGYLVCNGSAVSRTTYADLFAAIGTMYGSGDGSTTFNLPDYRGMFLRGHHFGKSSGTTDPDYATRQMGAAQSDLIKSHQHLLPYSNGATAPSGTHATPPWQGIDSTQHSTVAFGGTETRPVNVSVAYIIKH
ncbi:MAG TPA: phage tail protein [Spirochaetota bacterium]|nr:phage tail protein [Spirochaetota bacterium]HOS39094.1 phage tail protein [Spirochaetota bacterium]HPU86854.1 phage tail protein [Spirochaetota bacterium]